MPILKCKTHIEVYEHRAYARDSHELSGRGNKKYLTKFISHNILNEVQPKKTDKIVDIGCGDGTLLKIINGNTKTAIGVLPTKAEIIRIGLDIKNTDNVNLFQGTAQCTNIQPSTADIVICNGVLMYVDNAEIDLALKEMARITKKGGKVFLGEIPSIDEYKHKEFGSSILLWLTWTLRHQGFNAFSSRLKQTVTAMISNEPLVVAPKSHFFSEPAQFIERAKKNSLRAEKYFRHIELNDSREPIINNNRWNYIFIKD